MISDSGAFFALDLGSATTSVALLGHLGGRWRLVAHAAAPAFVEPDALLHDLLQGVAGTDPEMLQEIAAGRSADPAALVAALPRLVARSTPPRNIVVLAGSRRQRRLLELAAYRSGWLVSGGSADDGDLMALARLAFSGSCDAILVGADRSPAGDERRALPDLAALAAAARQVRPALTIVLAGGAAVYEPAFAGRAIHGSRAAAELPEAESALWREEEPRDGDMATGEPRSTGKDSIANESPDVHAEFPGNVLLAPDAEAGRPAGSALQQVLEGLRVLPNDARLGIVRSIASLAEILGRTVEVAEVGFEGGLRARSQPAATARASAAPPGVMPADGAFSPPALSDEVIDGVQSWSTVTFDRYRLADLLRNLRVAPWGEIDGDGATLRTAAARAALWRLAQAAPELVSHPLPEVLIAAGGVFAAMPPGVAALALADLLRRPGVAQLVFDHARLLGPIGVLEDEGERRRLLANLADDILLPLGCLVLPVGLKPGRSGGRLRVEGETGPTEIELHPGTLQVIDLPPGQAARVEADFRETVRLATKGRRFIFAVTGGLGGLLVDLRDVPLRLPDRPEPRRAALATLQGAMWPELDQ